MRKPKRTADQLRALIKERAAAFGPWPAKMTMLLYPMNDTWEVMVSRGKTSQEEEFRITVLWIATQMQVEFDLILAYDEMARPKDEFLPLFESEPDDRKQRRLNEALAAMDEDDTKCEALKAQLGFHEIENHLNDIYFNQVLSAQRIVIDTEAQTAAGLRAKASVLVEWFFEDSDRDSDYEPTEYEKLVSDVVLGVAEVTA